MRPQRSFTEKVLEFNMSFHDSVKKIFFSKHQNKVILVLKTMKGLDTVESLSVAASGFTKTRAFPTKSGQNISSSVGVTKSKESV